MQTAVRPQNKHLRPWTKGNAPKPPYEKRGGRPKKRDWVADLEALASTPAERLPFLRRVLKKYPVDALHYIAGKPLEQIRIEGTITASIDPATLDAAAAVAQRLMRAPGTGQDASQNSPLSLPSPEKQMRPESIVSEIEASVEPQKPETP